MLLFAIATMTTVSYSSNGTQTSKADLYGGVELVCQDMSTDNLLQADRELEIQYVLYVNADDHNVTITKIDPVAEPTITTPLYIERGALFWYSSKNDNIVNSTFQRSDMLKSKFLIADYINGDRLIC